MKKSMAASLFRRLTFALVMVAVLTSLIWRFHDMDRDPAPISWSQGDLLDPGTYLYNARSFALKGQWRGDEGLGFRLAPGFVLTAGLWMSLVGTDYSRAVLLSVLSGFILMACCAAAAEIAAARWFSPLPQWWAGGFTIWAMSISYVFLGLQQIPKGDMESMALSSISALLLFSLDSDRENSNLRRNAFAAGLTAGLAPFVKLHAAMFTGLALAAWICGYWICGTPWRARWRQLTPALAGGLGCSLIVWSLWFLWLRGVGGVGPAQDEVSLVFQGPHTLFGLFDSNLFYRQPVEIALAAIAGLRYIWSVRRSWSLLFCTFWLFGGAIFLAAMTYSPLRYRFLFVMPAIVLAAHLLTGLVAGRITDSATGATRASFICAVLLLTIMAVRGVQLKLGVDAGWMLLAMVAVVNAVTLSLLGNYIVRNTAGRVFVFAVVFPLMLGFAVPQWLGGEMARTSTFRAWAHQLEQRYPNMILGGDAGVQVALWTGSDAYLDPEANGQLRVTHILLSAHDDALAPSIHRFPVVLRLQHPRLPDPIIVRQITPGRQRDSESGP